MHTQADRLLVIQGPKLSCSLIQQARSNGTVISNDVLDEAAWEDVGGFRSILGFPLEFTRRCEPPEVAINQVVIHFVTAQSQRRALGLSDRPLFGMVYDDGVLRVLSATWTNETVSLLSGITRSFFP